MSAAMGMEERRVIAELARSMGSIMVSIAQTRMS